jgi:hypothetical protein
MADSNTSIDGKAPEMAIKSSVHTKAAGGNPQALAASLDVGKKALFSSTIGSATGYGKTKTEDIRDKGTYHESLDGTFEVINAETGQSVMSSALYAPAAIHEQLVGILKGTPGATVKIAYESYVCRGGTAGFTWEHVLKTDNSGVVDALAEMRSLLTKKAPVKELPKPVDTAVELPKKTSKGA